VKKTDLRRFVPFFTGTVLVLVLAISLGGKSMSAISASGDVADYRLTLMPTPAPGTHTTAPHMEMPLDYTPPAPHTRFVQRFYYDGTVTVYCIVTNEPVPDFLERIEMQPFPLEECFNLYDFHRIRSEKLDELYALMAYLGATDIDELIKEIFSLDYPLADAHINTLSEIWNWIYGDWYGCTFD